MQIILIAAMTPDRAIGKDGKVPWRDPADMKFFKKTTSGHAVIMGRKTYESMGKPLPRRRNIIITRKKDYRPDWASAATAADRALEVHYAPDDDLATRGAYQTCLEVAHSLDDALERCRRREESIVFIIGGAEIYALAMPVADEMLLTHVDHDATGADTFFPQWDTSAWKEEPLSDTGDLKVIRYRKAEE